LLNLRLFNAATLFTVCAFTAVAINADETARDKAVFVINLLDINSPDEIIVIKCSLKGTDSSEYYTINKQKNNI